MHERKEHRYLLQTPMPAQLKRGWFRRTSVILVDISIDGLAIACEKALPKNTQLEFHLKLGTQKLTITGEVIYQMGFGDRARYGVQLQPALSLETLNLFSPYFNEEDRIILQNERLLSLGDQLNCDDGCNT
ncbi:hypothetical protein VST7929_01773 [Vibrio stylophorae]|uniref:PilZ domain-containing protein n=1 Tax=Vibrio stylophorae TaxID=659351 RepID=A0ABN8DS09_9VIBR|nr:PilZ domain-containing protein [Vibrio stylophorae]CAH0533896.1 hypothetical protein VST7929_01773 [Vibrio stylophorae]